MDEKIDIKAILVKIISKWYYFLIGLLIVLPLAYVYIKVSKELYHISASILLKNEKSNGVGPEKFMKGMELLTSQTDLEDEIGIIKSYANVESTINTLNFGITYFSENSFKASELYGETPFIVTLDSSANQAMGVNIHIERISSTKYLVSASGENVTVQNLLTGDVVDILPMFEINEVADIEKPFVNKNLAFRITFDKTVKTPVGENLFFRINDIATIAAEYQEKLVLQPISKESNIVEVSIKEEVPQKGIDFLNRLLEVYLENELFKKNQLGLKTIQFIDSQLSGVSDSLKRVEGTLESFRSRNNVLDIRTTAANLTANLDRFEQEKAELEVKLKYYRYILSTMDKENVNDLVAPSTFGVTDQLLSSLLIELSKLNQERSGLNYSAREGNPLADVIDLKISNSKKLIKENVSNIINASEIALNDLNRRIAQANANLSRLPKNERELVKIQRKFDFSDNVYNYLLEKRAEAGVAIASNVVEKSIVDGARQVGLGPVSPNIKAILGVAILLAFGGALGLIMLKDFLNDSIVTTEDLERHTKIPFLGTINHGSRREKDNVIANALSPVGESFRTLRVNLQYLTFGKEINVIGFTSSRESEGKTFCSVNLAASIAQTRRKTILIDCDMRRPKVATYFRLENENGLSSFLIGDCSLKDVINETGIKGFDVITAGPIPPNPLDLIGLPKMEELINELKKVYGTIIIDCPPIGYVSEYVIIKKFTDANIYVVRSDYTTRHNLDRINKIFNDKKIDNISVLLNDVKYSRLNGYSYNYKYKYKKSKKQKVI